MKKEVVVAVLLGFGIGLIITFGVITARNALREHPTARSGGEASTESPSPAPDLSPSSQSYELTISSPADSAVIDQDHVAINGTTAPNAAVAITAEQDDFIVTVDNDGKFSQDVPLVGGANLIRVVSIGQTGNQKEAVLTVVYSTAEF